MASNLSAPKERSQQLEQRLQRPPPGGVPAETRNELAEIHHETQALLEGADGLLTSELRSGRQLAQSRRRAIVEQALALLSETESHTQQLELLRARTPTTSGMISP